VRQYCSVYGMIIRDYTEIQEYSKHFFSSPVIKTIPFVQEFMEKNGWRCVIPLCKRNTILYEDYEVYGLVIINEKLQRDNREYFKQEDFEVLSSMYYTFQSLETLFIEKNFARITQQRIFDKQYFIESMRKNYEKMIIAMQESSKNIVFNLHAFKKNSRGNYEKSEEKRGKSKEEVVKSIAERFFFEKKKSELYLDTIHQRTIIAQKIIEKNNKNMEYVITGTIPMFFSPTMSMSTAIIRYSDVGKKIEMFFPDKDSVWSNYKEEMIRRMMYTRIGISVLPLFHSKIHTHIFEKIGNFDECVSIFCSSIDEKMRGKTILTTMHRLFKKMEGRKLVTIFEVELLDRLEQSIIIDEYLSLVEQDTNFVGNIVILFYVSDNTLLWKVSERVIMIGTMIEFTIPLFELTVKTVSFWNMLVLSMEFLHEKSHVAQIKSEEDKENYIKNVLRYAEKSNTIIYTVYDFLQEAYQYTMAMEKEYLEMVEKKNLNKEKVPNLFETIDVDSEKNSGAIFEKKNIKEDFFDFEIPMKKESIEIERARSLKKKSLKDKKLMYTLHKIYEGNYSKIAELIGVHRSSVLRFFSKNHFDEE